ncbi:DUF1778 domain-containing protein [Asticcacaulis sp. BYS171W]|uniref:DUF1778 domain-containing protein n=1 Tax=Asticcacaulis aquaticus TaxID=2984212 RepID=A0ABT5HWL6_9CAUL|nr:DUF1778 domain-containing protein [Asticcacaulis aquaticus]MDC7684481.1 DUF1778 domain-containing protein [Asticcacaulis aquaticus]
MNASENLFPVFIISSPCFQFVTSKASTFLGAPHTNFIVQTALKEADSVIAAAEAVILSQRDFARVLELLENPPVPNAKLRAAIAALPSTL